MIRPVIVVVSSIRAANCDSFVVLKEIIIVIMRLRPVTIKVLWGMARYISYRMLNAITVYH